MAFLPNDGDIIQDAVLTDTGRYRMARGEFRIVKWACGDEEIDYSLFNNAHASGSAYYDLEILQSPVLEAFTNNASFLHSHCLSIPRTNMLYLPVLKANDVIGATQKHTTGVFIVAVDEDTEKSFARDPGVLSGEDTTTSDSHIRVDQGLDTTEVPPTFGLDADLVETQYCIEIDNRLGKIANPVSGQRARPSYIDDDNIASYLLTLDTDPNFVKENTNRASDTQNQVISGPRGTFLEFKIQTSLELNSQTYLFTKLGINTESMASQTIRYIDTIVRVRGETTGYSVDLPVRFVKNL